MIEPEGRARRPVCRSEYRHRGGPGTGLQASQEHHVRSVALATPEQPIRDQRRLAVSHDHTDMSAVSQLGCATREETAPGPPGRPTDGDLEIRARPVLLSKLSIMRIAVRQIGCL